MNSVSLMTLVVRVVTVQLKMLHRRRLVVSQGLLYIILSNIGSG